MLHHQAIHWPSVANVDNWSIAMKYAVYILNQIPHLTTTTFLLNCLVAKLGPPPSSKTFTYRAVPPMYSIVKLPAADGLSLVGNLAPPAACIGNSLKHGHHMPLILNLETGAITGQYHVVLDNWLHTVDAIVHASIDFNHDNWYLTFRMTNWQYVPNGNLSADPNNSTTLAIGAESVWNVSGPCTPMRLPHLLFHTC